MARHKKSDPRWRDEASAEVMAACVPQLDLGHRVLVAGEATANLRAALAEQKCGTSLWLRRATAASAAAAKTASVMREWPEDGPFTSALLRLPRAKDELDMMLHAAASRVVPGGLIIVYGANDEGIRSAAPRMEPLLGTAETVGQRAHCRVLVARRPTEVAGLKADLAAWRRVGQLAIAGTSRLWVSYPGAFAKGGLDTGTELLLAALADQTATQERKPIVPSSDCAILDFGCGTGVIAAHLNAHFAHARITMADWDALAVSAARANVPAATGQIAARLQDLPTPDTAGGFDLIVSNPPIHDGRSEDYTVLTNLISEAPARLAPKGSLVVVVQGRVPVEEWLSTTFTVVETRALDTRYRVWRASGPKSRGPARPHRTRTPRP